ncbi:MAG TPA: tail protein X [Polyangiaceae bacterium]|nr:tail protein X [Polyangiaceae bacterium]
MVQKYIEYKTVAGDRWDTIAHKVYGNAALYEPIITAPPNRRIPIRPVLRAGTTVYVPVREAPVAASAELPPWKRGNR